MQKSLGLRIAGTLALPFAGPAGAWAQGRTVVETSHSDSGLSIFTDAGYGKKWLGDFFPYQLPNADDIHAVLGKMLGIYNAGILVLASMVALYGLIMFIVETAHHGQVGGKRFSALYGQVRLLLAVALLTPILHGYNSAQVIIVQLAHAGSGLANTAWKEFTPYAATTDFNLPLSHGYAVNDLLQKALIDETCMAAIVGDQSDTAKPSVTLQAFYYDPVNPGRETEGREIQLKINAADSGTDAMTVGNALQTEADIRSLPVSRMRMHYNRAGYDDFCGSIDFPVPSLPTGSMLVSADQAIYALPYLSVRPEIGKFGQSMAAAVIAMLEVPPTSGAKAKDAVGSALAAAGALQGAAAGDVSGSDTSGKSALASKAKELPQASMSPQMWDDMVHGMEDDLNAAAQQASHDYIEPETSDAKASTASADWVTAGSLFFKLTKLSHDNVKLRAQTMGASLPDSSVLPAEMRADGQLAQCAPVLDTYILPDYHCRQDGKKTMLAIKIAYNLIHGVESQRSMDVVPAIDGAPAASRKEDAATTRLFSNAGLDGVVAELAAMTRPRDDANRPSAMFDAVNLGNMLFVSAAGLFRQAAQSDHDGGGGMSQGLLLTLFAGMMIVPAFFLSIVLPLLPAVRFFVGIATWLLGVFEALVLFPVVILGSMRNEDEGLLAHGRQGYLMILQMTLRPVLMIFGMIAAILIFDALYRFATWTVWSALLNVSADTGQITGSGVQGVLELTAYILLWSFLVYIAANIAFRAITIIPDRVLVWVTAQGAGSPNVRVTTEAAPVVIPPQPYNLVKEPLPQAVIQNDRMASQITHTRDTVPVTGEKPQAPPPTRANLDHFPKSRS